MSEPASKKVFFAKRSGTIPKADLAGRVVGGRYRLVRLIGEGGMATVWEAEHQMLGSPVAVKFLRPEMGESEQLRERFLREARTAAQIRHRNVVQIEDFGFDDQGVPYIVMERLEGETLAERLERDGKLEVTEAARIIGLTLRGLAAVHDKGILHRDLKPDNVFIVTDPDGDYPKLLDFGVCRVAGTADRSLTQEGTILGTPEYMSPEQARGRKKETDQTSDVYAMGIMLYESLTGRLPYESRHMGDLLMKVCTDPPTPIQHFDPTLAPSLVAVVHTAIAKERSQRFQSARAMRDALVDAFSDDWWGDVGSGIVTRTDAEPYVPEEHVEAEALRVRASAPAPADHAPRRARRGVGWIALLLAIGAAVAIALL